MEGIVDIKMLVNYQKLMPSKEWFSLIDILRRAKEFKEGGKVIRCKLGDKIKQLQVKTHKIVFNDLQCKMFTFHDLTS